MTQSIGDWSKYLSKEKKRITLSRYTRFSTLELIVKFIRLEVNGSRPLNIQVLILQKL